MRLILLMLHIPSQKINLEYNDLALALLIVFHPQLQMDDDDIFDQSEAAEVDLIKKSYERYKEQFYKVSFTVPSYSSRIRVQRLKLNLVFEPAKTFVSNLVDENFSETIRSPELSFFRTDYQ